MKNKGVRKSYVEDNNHSQFCKVRGKDQGQSKYLQDLCFLTQPLNELLIVFTKYKYLATDQDGK